MAKGSAKRRKKRTTPAPRSKRRTRSEKPSTPVVVPAPAVNLRYLTRRQVAELFDVHLQTITGWEQDGMPIEHRGGPGRPSHYSAPKLMKWRIQRELQARGAGETGSISPQHERALLDRKRAEDLELRLSVRRGELVSVEEAARDFAEVTSTVKSRLRRIPDAIADRLLTASANGPSAVKTLLLTEIDAALLELAKRADTLVAPAAPEPESGAA